MIHLNTAVAITGLSKRTLWRRIAQGAIGQCDKDANGKIMLSLQAVMAHARLPLEAEDLDLIKRADSGEMEAQNDLGLLLLEADRDRAAIYWLDLAARQEHPDAMYWFGRCCIVGQGMPKDEQMGLMWLGKAAACGHVIAQQQVQGLAQAWKAA